MQNVIVKVPEEGLKAAMEAGRAVDGFRANNLRACLKAFIRWQSEQSQSPSYEQLASMKADLRFRMVDFDIKKLCGEWVRRMYLAPLEPEVPQALFYGEIEIG